MRDQKDKKYKCVLLLFLNTQKWSDWESSITTVVFNSMCYQPTRNKGNLFVFFCLCSSIQGKRIRGESFSFISWVLFDNPSFSHLSEMNEYPEELVEFPRPGIKFSVIFFVFPITKWRCGTCGLHRTPQSDREAFRNKKRSKWQGSLRISHFKVSFVDLVEQLNSTQHGSWIHYSWKKEGEETELWRIYSNGHSKSKLASQVKASFDMMYVDTIAKDTRSRYLHLLLHYSIGKMISVRMRLQMI